MSRSAAALLAAVVAVAACGLLRAPAPPTGPVRTGPRIWEERSSGEGRSYAIYPTQRIPLRFDHARHLALAGVTCVRCHDGAAGSDSAADRLVPAERTCVPCHAIDRAQPQRAANPPARCDACHTGFDPATPAAVARVEIPAANLVFSHRAHLARGARCEQCHGDLRRIGLATRLELPAMRTCLACHHDGGASATCATCHLAEPGGVLRTRFAEGWLNPPEWMPGLHHDADFWVNHRVAAADSAARCVVCHRESECLDCHDGRVRDRRVHPNDYLTLHPAEARQSAERCTSCHRTATFCETCHLRAGVAQASAPLSRGTARFHPPALQWSGLAVGPGHHALEARRNLSTCVSCHTERDCTTCHAATGLGGTGISPHPPGWLARCGSLLRAAPRACAQCHEDPAALAARCP